MKHPEIQLKTSILGYLVEIFSLLITAGIILIPIIFYTRLPVLIPSHYSILGQPDAFSPRWSVFIIPVLALLTYSGISILQKFPHIFNYPVNVTEANAKHLYSVGLAMARAMKFDVSLTFFYITYSNIQYALGRGEGINKWIILFLIILIIFTMTYNIIKMYSKKYQY